MDRRTIIKIASEAIDGCLKEDFPVSVVQFYGGSILCVDEEGEEWTLIDGELSVDDIKKQMTGNWNPEILVSGIVVEGNKISVNSFNQ